MKKELIMMFVMVVLALGGLYFYTQYLENPIGENSSFNSDNITNLFIFAGGTIIIVLFFFLGLAFYKKHHY